MTTTFTLAEPTTIGDALQQGSAHLRESGVGSGNIEAAILLSMVTGLDRLRLITYMSRKLSPNEHDEFVTLVDRRASREPIQYITGKSEFMGLEFEVSPAVLVPRPDTEILVEAVLDAEESAGARDDVLIADVGTGSGAIAVSLASYLRYSRVIAVEISPGALATARANMKRHGVADRIELLQGDGLAPLAPYAGRLSHLVSNPPYIPSTDIPGLEPEVRDYEPRVALTPGEDGLTWYRRFASQGPELLMPGGLLSVEVGSDQAEAVMELLRADGRWDTITSRRDLGGIERVVQARRRD